MKVKWSLVRPVGTEQGATGDADFGGLMTTLGASSDTVFGFRPMELS